MLWKTIQSSIESCNSQGFRSYSLRLALGKAHCSMQLTNAAGNERMMVEASDILSRDVVQEEALSPQKTTCRARPWSMSTLEEILTRLGLHLLSCKSFVNSSFSIFTGKADGYETPCPKMASHRKPLY